MKNKNWKLPLIIAAAVVSFILMIVFGGAVCTE